MFTRPDVAAALTGFVLVDLYTDGADDASRQNQELQEKGKIIPTIVVTAFKFKEIDALVKLTEMRVNEIMSKPVITINPEMDIRYCARLFARFELSRAPVVENREVIGIISFTDMVVKGLQ